MSVYTDLITSQNAQKPDFVATVELSTSAVIGLKDVLSTLPESFDVDSAIGVQLDAVGLWVGISRRISTPLTGVYFAWDASVDEGWDDGSWQGQFDPNSGLVDLPDESYRRLLKAKIAANRWDGSIPNAYAVWLEAFGAGSVLVIQDNQDMSMTVGIAGGDLSSIDKALLFGGYLPLKPAGVRINYYALAPDGDKLFAWDIAENEAFAGWDSGSWGIEFAPPSPPVVNPVLVNGFLVTVNGEGVFV